MLIFRPAVSYNIAIGASSTRGQATSSGVLTVRLVSDVDCYIKLDPSVAADTTTSLLLKASTPEYFHVHPTTQINVIQSTATGTLNVTEMTR